MGTQSAGRAVTLQRPPVAVLHCRSTASLGAPRLRAPAPTKRQLGPSAGGRSDFVSQVSRGEKERTGSGSFSLEQAVPEIQTPLCRCTVSLSSVCSCTPARELGAFGQQPGSLLELRAAGPHEAAVLAVVVPFRRRRPSPVRRAKGGEARVLRVVDERHLSQEGMHRYRLPTARAERTLRARRRMKGVPYRL